MAVARFRWSIAGLLRRWLNIWFRGMVRVRGGRLLSMGIILWYSLFVLCWWWMDFSSITVQIASTRSYGGVKHEHWIRYGLVATTAIKELVYCHHSIVIAIHFLWFSISCRRDWINERNKNENKRTINYLGIRSSVGCDSRNTKKVAQFHFTASKSDENKVTWIIHLA